MTNLNTEMDLQSEIDLSTSAKDAAEELILGEDLIEQMHNQLELLEDLGGRFRVALREIHYRAERLAARH